MPAYLHNLRLKVTIGHTWYGVNKNPRSFWSMHALVRIHICLLLACSRTNTKIARYVRLVLYGIR